MCFKSSTPKVPPAPPPPPDPPRLQDPANLNARNMTVNATKGYRGSTSTILAGGGALSDAAVGAGKTLLGR